MKTKFIKIAQSGKTIDGREISPADINQMAASYSPATYGARVNLEHFRSLLPDSPFRMYGDVLALRAEDGPNDSRVLLAELDLTDDAVAMLNDRQKIYWSVEIMSPFPTTGGAYLGGVAMTDSPASLGTESLKFTVLKASLGADRQNSLFSLPLDGALEYATPDQPAPSLTGPAAAPAPPPAGPTIFDKVAAMFNKGKQPPVPSTDLEKAFEAIAMEMAALKVHPPSPDALNSLSQSVSTLTGRLDDLVAQLSRQPDSPGRPPATGGTGTYQTDC